MPILAMSNHHWGANTFIFLWRFYCSGTNTSVFFCSFHSWRMNTIDFLLRLGTNIFIFLCLFHSLETNAFVFLCWILKLCTNFFFWLSHYYERYDCSAFKYFRRIWRKFCIAYAILNLSYFLKYLPRIFWYFLPILRIRKMIQNANAITQGPVTKYSVTGLRCLMTECQGLRLSVPALMPMPIYKIGSTMTLTFLYKKFNIFGKNSKFEASVESVSKVAFTGHVVNMLYPSGQIICSHQKLTLFLTLRSCWVVHL